MEIYKQAVERLISHPFAASWPEMSTALRRGLTRAPVAWHFPVKACEALGSAPEAATPAVASITCVHMAIILVDDILDDDPRGEYRRVGAGPVANLAIGLNSLGAMILQEAKELAPDNRLLAMLALNEMIGGTAFGQDLDIKNTQTEEGYWAVAHAKSSPYFGTTLFIGALFGGADLATANQLKLFGEIYGEIMQIHDDLNDCLDSPANVDWTSGRSPLPILFAQIVEHPQRQRFIELRQQVSDIAKLEEAQSILVSSGAISYCVHQLMLRHQSSLDLLKEISLASHEPLEQLLEEAIAPVNNLFNRLGAELPASS